MLRLLSKSQKDWLMIEVFGPKVEMLVASEDA